MLEARATQTSRYERRTDNIFGKVDSFRLVHEYRVQVRIGNLYFTSNKTYANAGAAHRAALRMQERDPRHRNRGC